MNIVCSSSNGNTLIFVIPIISNASGVQLYSGQDVDIPLKPFYYYNNIVDYIVFGKENAILSSNVKQTNQKAPTSFGQIILFYNPAGIGSYSNPFPDDIYIDCGPILEEQPTAQTPTEDDGKGHSTLWIWILVPFLIIIILFLIAYYFIYYRNSI
jgi:hypothetical protein